GDGEGIGRKARRLAESSRSEDDEAELRLCAQSAGGGRHDYAAGANGGGSRHAVALRTAAAQEHAGLLGAHRRLGVVGIHDHSARFVHGRSAARLRQGARRQRGRSVHRRTIADVHRGGHGALPELQVPHHRYGDPRQGRTVYADGAAEEKGCGGGYGPARGDAKTGDKVKCRPALPESPCGATIAAGTAPTTATRHATIASRRTLRIIGRTLLIVVFAVPIVAPLPNVAVQIE